MTATALDAPVFAMLVFWFGIHAMPFAFDRDAPLATVSACDKTLRSSLTAINTGCR